jgi:hypothetical protein
MPLHKDVTELLPEIQGKVYSAIEELNAKRIAFLIMETYREQAVQDSYYAQGRESLQVVNNLRVSAGLRSITDDDNKQIITKAKNSLHTLRRAIDIVPVSSSGDVPWNVEDSSTADLWINLATVMKDNGFEWGGDWDPKDKWGIGWDSSHYQISEG